jgi:hypothetical protein
MWRSGRLLHGAPASGQLTLQTAQQQLGVLQLQQLQVQVLLLLLLLLAAAKAG